MKYLEYSKEVQEALKSNKPIVALESTIIAHGMPYPENYNTAVNCGKIIRDNGCVPATIAIIGGKLKVGLSKDELEYIAKNGSNVIKTSRRDIPVIVSKGLDGATTVSATMFIASLAGIKVFATGGIGGVHRGFSEDLDISADLDEFAGTNVLVVSSGVKSILDIPNTLEYLETKGVPVIGYKTDSFPAFYTRESGLGVDYNLDEAEIGKMAKAKWELGLKGGILVANPIPLEYSYKKEEIDLVIEEALNEAHKANVKGKKITPFLLSYIANKTEGKSLEANIKLVYNNAKIASLIAKEIK